MSKNIEIKNTSTAIGVQGSVKVEQGNVYINCSQNSASGTKGVFVGQTYIPNVVESFNGRDKPLECIKNIIFENNMCVVSGLPGIGKTTLAAKFACDNRHYFENNLIWIKSAEKDALESSFINFAKLFNIMESDIQTIVNNVYLHFNNKKCLFIFDNATNLRDLTDYLPSKERHDKVEFYVLITSLYNDWKGIINYNLTALASDDTQMVIKKIVSEEYYKEYSTELWLKLNKIVHGIPLAIQIVSALIFNEIQDAKDMCEDFDLNEYIEFLAKDEVNFLEEHLPENTVKTYDSTIYTAILQILKRIEKSNNAVSKATINALQVIAYLNPDYIEEDIIVSYFEKHKIKVNLRNVLPLLKRYSIITIVVLEDQKRYITVHRLVQKTIRRFQQNENMNETYYMNLIGSLRPRYEGYYYHIKNYIEENIECCLKIFSEQNEIAFLLLLVLCEMKHFKVLEIIFDRINPEILENIVAKATLLYIVKYFSSSKLYYITKDSNDNKFAIKLFVFNLDYTTLDGEVIKLLQLQSNVISDTEIERQKALKLCIEFLAVSIDNLFSNKTALWNTEAYKIDTTIDENILNVVIYYEMIDIKLRIKNYIKDLEQNIKKNNMPQFYLNEHNSRKLYVLTMHGMDISFIVGQHILNDAILSDIVSKVEKKNSCTPFSLLKF